MGYDEFGFEETWDPFPDPSPPSVAPAPPHVPMRAAFPPAGSDYMGGHSDGVVYRSTFAGGTLAHTYGMVRAFLTEEGYGDIPLPETAEELRLFRRPQRSQLQFFEERGYRHNPIKILFPAPSRQKHALELVIYNERAEKHLLRFHGLLPE